MINLGVGQNTPGGQKIPFSGKSHATPLYVMVGYAGIKLNLVISLVSNGGGSLDDEIQLERIVIISFKDVHCTIGCTKFFDVSGAWKN